MEHTKTKHGAAVAASSLPYVSDLLSSELYFVFLEELSAQEQKKREKKI